MLFDTQPQQNGNSSLILYHGSKSGIQGEIRPVSRSFCDFGSGFYMGTEQSQPLTLICNFPNALLYQIQLHLSGLNVLHLNADIDWALFIAFNRGKMQGFNGTEIYKKYDAMSKHRDIITGYIANDRMFFVLDRFFNGEITDIALINSLAALKLGKQYVALTQKACQQISILNSQPISSAERQNLQIVNEAHRKQGISLANEICRQYRREGRFFDEIIGDGNK